MKINGVDYTLAPDLLQLIIDSKLSAKEAAKLINDNVTPDSTREEVLQLFRDKIKAKK